MILKSENRNEFVIILVVGLITYFFCQSFNLLNKSNLCARILLLSYVCKRFKKKSCFEVGKPKGEILVFFILVVVKLIIKDWKSG